MPGAGVIAICAVAGMLVVGTGRAVRGVAHLVHKAKHPVVVSVKKVAEHQK